MLPIYDIIYRHYIYAIHINPDKANVNQWFRDLSNCLSLEKTFKENLRSFKKYGDISSILWKIILWAIPGVPEQIFRYIVGA